MNKMCELSFFEPLLVIDTLFGKNKDLKAEDVQKHYEEFFECPDNIKQISSLNNTPTERLKSGQLIHYRGMIQDMFDPEYFYSACEAIDNQHLKNSGEDDMMLRQQESYRIICGLYRDILTQKPNEELNIYSERNKNGERQVLYCVPIPGEMEWSKREYESKYKDPSLLNNQNSSPPVLISNAKKRKPDDNFLHLNGSSINPDRNNRSDHTNSITNCDQEVEEMIIDADSYNSGSSKTKYLKKEFKTDDSNVESNGKKINLNLNFPLSFAERGIPVILKVYGDGVSIKLNKVYDVIGILSIDSQLDWMMEKPSEGEREEAYMEDECELAARHPPPQIVPRIHALKMKKLNPSNTFSNDISSFPWSEMKMAREILLSVLTKLLLGDQLAAEYLLCHLLSGVYSRQDVLVLGKYSLNVSNVKWPSEYTESFYNILSHILEKLHLFKMSLTNMNSVSLVPKKDYSRNRLQAAILQLSDRTHLMVDETALQSGKLDETGVKNISALNSVLEWQKLDYDFEYHFQPFQTDIIILLLSEGKSLLKCDCHIPLKVDSIQPSDYAAYAEDIVVNLLTDSNLKLIRNYLAYVRRLTFDIDPHMRKFIETDFVESRKTDVNSMTPEDMHALLLLARYIVLSHSNERMKLENWHKAKQMEQDRKMRGLNN